VPHFVGLHALQLLPLVSLLLARRRFAPAARVRLTLVAAASYAALYVILVLQALRGLPLVAPDATTLVQLGVWLLATATAAGLTLLDRDAARHTLHVEL
jgi:hypothetical protein